jgi:antitoxin VapB
MIDLSPETERLARRLADERHVPVDAAVREALEASAVTSLLKPARPRDRSPEAIAARRARVDQIVREIAAMPILDHRSPQEIIDDINAI